MNSSFSVIIPTKNRYPDLKKCVNSILESDSIPSEIIVVDQSDSFEDIVFEGYNQIKHIKDNEITGLCNAKNIGVENASYDILFFFDDDIIVYKDFFSTILKTFHENENIAGISGKQVNSKSSRLKVSAFNFFHRGPYKDIRKKFNSGFFKEDVIITNVLPGGVTAYRKKVFDDFSFDETLIKYCLGEDFDFSYRVSKKYSLALQQSARVIHNHSLSGRYDAIESFACKVASYYYFLVKNLNGTKKAKHYYNLVRAGLWFDAFFYMVTHFSFASFKGIRKGKKYIKSGLKNVPFINYEKFANHVNGGC